MINKTNVPLINCADCEEPIEEGDFAEVDGDFYHTACIVEYDHANDEEEIEDELLLPDELDMNKWPERF